MADPVGAMGQQAMEEFIQRFAIPPSIHVGLAQTQGALQGDTGQGAGVVDLHVPGAGTVDTHIGGFQHIPDPAGRSGHGTHGGAADW